MPANERMERWIESIRIVWDFCKGHKAFDKMIDQLDGEAVSPDSNDNRIERVAEMLFQKEHFLPFEQLPFGLIGEPLAIAGFPGDRIELGMRKRRLSSPRHCGFENAMNDEIGIPAYRRSEVGIGVRRQSEMTGVLLRVSGLFERTQHEVRQHSLFWPAFNRDDKFLKICGLCLPWFELEPKTAHDIDEFLDFHRIGFFMDAIQARNLVFLEMPCHDFVGENHELLDNAVRKQTYRFCDSRYLPPFVVGQHLLWYIDFNRAPLAPSILYYFSQLCEPA